MRTLALLTVLLVATPFAIAAHPEGSGPRSLGGRTVPMGELLLSIEAEDFVRRPRGQLVADEGASGGVAWRMDVYGVIETDVVIPSTGVVWLEVRARGSHPPGMMNPHMHPVVDGEQRGEWDVTDLWIVYRQTLPMLGGSRVLGIDNFNNYHAEAADRTLDVDWVRLYVPTLEGAPSVGNETVIVDAPDIHAAGTGLDQPAPDARGGTQWLMWGIGCYAHAFILENDGAHTVTARLRGNEKLGHGTNVTVRVDGRQLDAYESKDAWAEHTTTFDAMAGAHVLEICYDNDFGGPEKRNLWLDDLAFARLPPPPPVTTPEVTPPPSVTPPPTEAPATTPPVVTEDAPPAIETKARIPELALLAAAALGVAALASRQIRSRP